jgi:alpha-ketoglutaric semialdehyde dehydrogenase
MPLRRNAPDGGTRGPGGAQEVGVKPALLLIDLQKDYLAAANLEPAAGFVVAHAAQLREGCRRLGIPVIHVWTTVHRVPDDRMPHWKSQGLWRCVDGTTGHQTPAEIAPVPGERAFQKQFFSAFGAVGLEHCLREWHCDTLLVAGVHLHACVRETVLDAYQRGLTVWVAEDAVGSDDPLHAAITQRFLARRAAWVAPVQELLARLDGKAEVAAATRTQERIAWYSPMDTARLLWETPADEPGAIQAKVQTARIAWPAWRQQSFRERSRQLQQWAMRLLDAEKSLSEQIVADIGKPITMARAEVHRTAELLNVTADQAEPVEITASAEARFGRRPLGVVAAITPYNNPVAIALGKIGPALVYGNTVVWKPAPAAAMIARMVLELGHQAGLSDHVVQLCLGSRNTALLLAEDRGVEALTVSGSAKTGYALQEACGRTHKPFQAELGGNNAAIVWEDAPLSQAAELIAHGAFGFAGQRCTANRRVIVAESILGAFLGELQAATRRLAWGDPRDPATVVGPMASREQCDEIHALLQRAAGVAGNQLHVPHRAHADFDQHVLRGAFVPPTIVVVADPAQEIVEEESFGPVLVVQRASDFAAALQLANGVRQGLIMALFSASRERQEQFLRQARAGVLKFNRATADAEARSPLGGWKASGVGPAEHGPSDCEFYTRVQTIYGA